jgi:hypothetical protein
MLHYLNRSTSTSGAQTSADRYQCFRYIQTCIKLHPALVETLAVTDSWREILQTSVMFADYSSKEMLRYMRDCYSISFWLLDKCAVFCRDHITHTPCMHFLRTWARSTQYAWALRWLILPQEFSCPELEASFFNTTTIMLRAEAFNVPSLELFLTAPFRDLAPAAAATSDRVPTVLALALNEWLTKHPSSFKAFAATKNFGRKKLYPVWYSAVDVLLRLPTTVLSETNPSPIVTFVDSMFAAMLKYDLQFQTVSIQLLLSLVERCWHKATSHVNTRLAWLQFLSKLLNVTRALPRPTQYELLRAVARDGICRRGKANQLGALVVSQVCEQGTLFLF